MRRIADVIIVTTIILGFVAATSGFRTVGIVSFLIGILFSWNRNWCDWTWMKAQCAGGASETREINADVPTLLAETAETASSDGD